MCTCFSTYSYYAHPHFCSFVIFTLWECSSLYNNTWGGFHALCHVHIVGQLCNAIHFNGLNFLYYNLKHALIVLVSLDNDKKDWFNCSLFPSLKF